MQDMMDSTNQKKEMRARQLIARRSILPQQKEQANRSITDKLFARPQWQNAKMVCLYLSLPDEVDTRPLLQKLLNERRPIVVPKVANSTLILHSIRSMDDLSPGAFQILEPIDGSTVFPVDAVDLFIIPGIAFDRMGHRLGWGKGHYDRLLEHVSTPRIALAYAIQVIAEVPHSSYDVSVSTIITEKEIIETHS